MSQTGMVAIIGAQYLLHSAWSVCVSGEHMSTLAISDHCHHTLARLKKG